ncbi:hypothetical protein COM56_26950 [Bacillus cereus]|nr:hypothetical protein COM56_26950 [Bacillus cereus]
MGANVRAFSVLSQSSLSPPKYISDFSNISAQLQLYRRFSKYISATQFISAIFIIYRLTDKKRHNKHS